MRLDANRLTAAQNALWTIWHARDCRIVPHVAWVDDEIHAYAAWHPRIDGTDGNDLRIHSVRRIVIVEDVRVVLINPLTHDWIGERLQLAREDLMEALRRRRAAMGNGKGAQT